MGICIFARCTYVCNIVYYIVIKNFNVNISPRAYSKEGKLGNGGFGVVYHVVERNTGNNYALKVVRLPENE